MGKMGEIRFKCSSCGQAMIADSSLSGKKVVCPSCGAEVVAADFEQNAAIRGSADSAERKISSVVNFPLWLAIILSGILLVNIISLGISCLPLVSKYEYKAVMIYGEAVDSKMDEFLPRKLDEFTLERTLNSDPEWELVDIITETETVHPNFGNDDYVAGIQPNVRTRSVILLLRRRI